MSYFKLFEDFINELNFTKHWIDRTSLFNSLSRINPASEKFKDGWKCDKLFNIDEKGNIINTVEYKDFLEANNMTTSEFNDKVVKSLRALTNGKVIENIKYGKSTSEYKAINLGKIAFKIGNKLYNPNFVYSNGKYTGNVVWGFVGGYEQGITIKYHTQKFPDVKLEESGYLNYKEQESKNIRGFETKKMSKNEFLLNFSIIKTLEDRVLIITDDKDWENKVIQQGDNMNYDIDPVRMTNKTSDEEVEKYFKEVNLVVNENSELFYRGKVKTSIFSITDPKLDKSKEPQGMTFELRRQPENTPVVIGGNIRQTFFPGQTISLVSKTEKDERTDGNLPAGEPLIKTVKIDYIQKNRKDLTIIGKVIEIFTFNPKTSKETKFNS